MEAILSHQIATMYKMESAKINRVHLAFPIPKIYGFRDISTFSYTDNEIAKQNNYFLTNLKFYGNRF